MLRKRVMDDKEHAPDGFRWRGNEPSRIEGFSDAVFAFAITLLVVALEVPRTYSELIVAMRGFVSFGLCFLLVYWMWRIHCLYFRRYGAQDNLTIWLNGLLLFVILFYVYPLKFLFSTSIGLLLGIDTRVALPDGKFIEAVTAQQTQPLMMIYGAGYAAVFLVFTLMYLRAYSLRDHQALDAREITITLAGLATNIAQALIGLVVVVGALVLRDSAGLAGFLFFLAGPAITLVEMWKGRRLRALEKSAVAAN